ncbi:MAG: hypothetical protein LJE63_17835, partial [Desulfobacteraceae bacterium]|nr:hypothetical protein [Desulfobacteraceae bacterium]
AAFLKCSFSFAENEPKETARGGPCGTRLRSNSHRAFIAACCDARPGTMGQTPGGMKPQKYGCHFRKMPYLRG